MKYKIIGVLDILFSSLFLISQVGLVLFVYPKLYALYENVNVQLPFITRYYYLISLFNIFLYSGFFILGIKLLKTQNKRLFLLGVLALIFMLMLSGYFIGTSAMGIVSPLYNLTSEI